jgi:hypothetical protein
MPVTKTSAARRLPPHHRTRPRGQRIQMSAANADRAGSLAALFAAQSFPAPADAGTSVFTAFASLVSAEEYAYGMSAAQLAG